MAGWLWEAYKNPPRHRLIHGDTFPATTAPSLGWRIQRASKHKQMTGAFPFVLVIVTLGLSGMSRNRKTCLPDTGKVARQSKPADSGDLFGISVQDVFHGVDEVRIDLGDAPLLTLPRLQIVFFMSVARFHPKRCNDFQFHQAVSQQLHCPPGPHLWGVA